MRLTDATIKEMSYDQATLTLAVIDDITGVSKAEDLERDIVVKLMREWTKATSEVMGQIESFAVTSATPKISNAEIKKLLDYFKTRLGATFAFAVQDDISQMLGKGYQQAKREIIKLRSMSFEMLAIDFSAIGWLQDHHLYWIREFYDRRLSKKIADVIADGMLQGLGRADIGDMLQSAFKTYKGMGVQPDAYWRGLAANGMTRSRNFGEIQAFVEAEIEHYSLINPMDEKTSSICREIVPKYQKVPVIKAVEQRDALMAAKKPEDVKTIAPWPTPASIKGKSMNQMLKQNVVTPPFHNRCRTQVVISE